MRCIISLLNFRPQRVGGTETYLRNLLTALPAVAGGHELILLLDRDLAASEPFPEFRAAVVPLSARQVLRQRALEAFTPYRSRAAEEVVNALKADAIFFPQQSIFPKSVRLPTTLVVHDLYHVYFPQYLSQVQRLYREAIYPFSMRQADKIIAISEYTGRTIRRHYPAVADKIVTVPHGFEPVLDAPLGAPLDVPRPFIFFPAATLPHKNHRALFGSVAALRAQRQFDYHIVLSGVQTPFWATLQADLRRLKLTDLVIHVGYQSYDRIWRLYHDAECIVFPSIFEGFGLPVCEAVAFGKKVITSRLEVFDELGLPRQFQIDFADPQQLRQALGRPERTILARPPWSWQRCAEATLAELAAAAGAEPALGPRILDPHILPALPEATPEAQRRSRRAA